MKNRDRTLGISDKLSLNFLSQCASKFALVLLPVEVQPESKLGFA